MQNEQATNRDDVRELEGFANLQTETEVAEFEAWLDGFVEWIPSDAELKAIYLDAMMRF